VEEAEQEVTVHAEKPAVRKEAVPVERRLGKQTVAEERTVTSEVRKEQIEVTDAER
jgi:stress response protein YsnF